MGNESYEKYWQKVLNSDEKLTDAEKKHLAKDIDGIQHQISELQKRLLDYGRLNDYDDLKKKGFSAEEIKAFVAKDSQMIDFAQALAKDNATYSHDHMFGYPANMMSGSYVTRYLRWLESRMYFMNSCGNAYCQGNYKMNNAEQELRIIDLIKENLGLDADEYWGYITMGGTEGNMWGIREGFNRFPNGILYFSDAAHYSVSKMSDLKSDDSREVISSINEQINTDELLSKIVKNYNERGSPAILLLTFGTTTFGSIDNIEMIVKALEEYSIPHYIHVDAALYGGIPNNQINSPISRLNEIAKLGIDSISVSFHKYLGSNRVNGILLSKSISNRKFVDYIGNLDVTFLGSRDFPAFSILQQIEELYNRSNSSEYTKNIILFEYLLKENDIPYFKGDPNGNIFVISNPGDEICQKYQLSSFTRDGKRYAHIIIFPYHNESIINELVMDIKKAKMKELPNQKVQIKKRKE